MKAGPMVGLESLWRDWRLRLVGGGSRLTNGRRLLRLQEDFNVTQQKFSPFDVHLFWKVLFRINMLPVLETLNFRMRIVVLPGNMDDKKRIMKNTIHPALDRDILDLKADDSPIFVVTSDSKPFRMAEFASAYRKIREGDGVDLNGRSGVRP
jgi:hypothetical protein